MKYFIRDIETETPYEQITKEELEKVIQKWDAYNENKWWYDMYAVRLEKIENGDMYFGVAPNEM
jgi:hypothetical protein